MCALLLVLDEVEVLVFILWRQCGSAAVDAWLLLVDGGWLFFAAYRYLYDATVCCWEFAREEEKMNVTGASRVRSWPKEHE